MLFQPSTLPNLAHVLIVLLLIVLHVSIVLGTSVRVIMRRPPSGVALAWMFLVASLPVVGFVFYLLIGERRVGLRRARRIAALRKDYAPLARQAIDRGLTQVSWDKHRPEARGMDRLGTSLVGMPTVAGSMARFHSDSDEILRAIAQDIDNAQKSVLMEFYIWNEGGAADEVLEALVAPGSGACRAGCWSMRSARGPGGEGGNRNGFARRACGSNRPCPSVCCKPWCRETIFVCTARSSWPTVAWPGQGA